LKLLAKRPPKQRGDGGGGPSPPNILLGQWTGPGTGPEELATACFAVSCNTADLVPIAVVSMDVGVHALRAAVFAFVRVNDGLHAAVIVVMYR
jgi:hypothetical protein